jgi:hypothetical protein
MKKFTLFFILAFMFVTINQTLATKEVKVTSMIKPIAGSSIPANVPNDFEFVVTNSGTESILATDSIYIGWGPYNGTTVTLQSPVRFVLRPGGMAPNDTFHYTFRLTINSTTPGQVGVGFLASLTLQIANFKGIAAVYNLTVGINDFTKSINKVYYANGNLYANLAGKSNTTAKMWITNMNGQIIKTDDLNLTTAETTETYNLGILPKGIYMFTVSSTYGKETRKFVVE